MFWKTVLVIIGIFQITKGLEFGFHYHCGFQCGDTSKAKSDSVSSTPKAYYWRDFHGAIPPDAYPIGSPDQSPKTYIGLVFDSKNAGVFATTIFDGLDYVYNVLDGNVSKITQHIQILCIGTPTDFAWLVLNSENIDKIAGDGFRLVEAGYNPNAKRMLDFHYISKTNDGKITYAGIVNYWFAEKMEYVMNDGSPKTTNNLTLLFYKPNNTQEITTAPQKSYRPFFNQQFAYGRRSGSYIPNVYHKIKIGGCSVTCTNLGKKTADNGESLKLSASLAYYWQPQDLVDKAVSVPSGKGYDGTVSYVGQGQAYSRSGFFDVGSITSTMLYIYYNNSIALEANYYHVLGSNNQEKLQWVNSSTEEFSKLDRNRLIPGGLLGNGTETFVCRSADYKKGAYFPGSARVLPTGTLCVSSEGSENKFEVLMYKQS